MRGKRNKIKTKHKSKKIPILIVIIILILGIAAGCYYYFYIYNQNQNKENSPVDLGTAEGLKPEEPKQQESIFKGNDRPIAIMIDNHQGAWPQVGLNKAYSVYEIIVEGGESRLMALFKGVDLDEIGPVRSARHYFLDYALENDAIYVHYGWSPKAQSDISTLNVDNINGISESTESFWRTKKKSAPHNVLTSTKDILEIAKSKKYDTTSDKDSVLNYTFSEVNLDNGITANNVTIPYSDLHTVNYKYDAETKRYIRYARGEKQTDMETGEPITTKNIIITFEKNSPLKDTENKDRQDLSDVGTNNGYYITNGKAIKIKCIKNSRTSQTKYEDLQGNEISVNDGNTFFNICPIDSNVTFE